VFAVGNDKSIEKHTHMCVYGVGRALEAARVAQFQRKTPAMKSFLVCSARPFVLVGLAAHF
jgi:hypothetical protein